MQNWIYRLQIKENENDEKTLKTNIFESAKKSYECAHANKSRRLLQFLELYLATIVENDKISLETKIECIIDLLVNKNNFMIDSLNTSSLVDQILALLSQMDLIKKKAKNKKSVLLKKK